MGRPKYGPRAEVPPEVFHLLESLERAAEAVGARFREDLKRPAWVEETRDHVNRLTSLLLVKGESGRPAVVAQLDDLAARVARLEAAAPPLRGPAKVRGGAR